METFVFLVAGAIVLGGAIGVISLRNPVHAALSLVATLFGIAVLFIALEAHFLAAVQVIVYAGAIVVLFLFVIMLLGVDKTENLQIEPIAGQRPVGLVLALGVFGLSVVALLNGGSRLTGIREAGVAAQEQREMNRLAEAIFTDYVLAFEITAVLLTIAVVGAVILARRPPAGAAIDTPALATDTAPAESDGPDTRGEGEAESTAETDGDPEPDAVEAGS